MLSEEQKSQIKMSMNDKWHLVKLTHVWPDGHLINQMAHALIERNAELLSLREQLAELKALEPVGQIVLSDYDSDGTRTARVVCLHKQADWDNFQDGTLLFTAAKPADGSEIAKFMAGVKNSMSQEVAEAIQKEALRIMFDEITPDTETIAMQYESLSKRINRPEDKC